MKTLFIATLLSASMGAAYADDPEELQVKGGEITLQQLKQKCNAFAQHEQLKPFTVSVECSSSETVWEKEAKEIQLPTEQINVGQAKGKAWLIPNQTTQEAQTPATETCYVYREKKVTYEPTQLQFASCEELAQVEHMGNYCANAGKGSKFQKTKTSEEYTGRYINSCDHYIKGESQFKGKTVEQEQEQQQVEQLVGAQVEQQGTQVFHSGQTEQITGVQVKAPAQESFMASIGLEEGDLIVAVNGKQVSSAAELARAIKEARANAQGKVQFTVRKKSSGQWTMVEGTLPS